MNRFALSILSKISFWVRGIHRAPVLQSSESPKNKNLGTSTLSMCPHLVSFNTRLSILLPTPPHMLRYKTQTYKWNICNTREVETSRSFAKQFCKAEYQPTQSVELAADVVVTLVLKKKNPTLRHRKPHLLRPRHRLWDHPGCSELNSERVYGVSVHGRDGGGGRRLHEHLQNYL